MRGLEDKQNVYWGYLYLKHLNLYLTDLYVINLYLTNLRQIQNALIRTQSFRNLYYFDTQTAFLFQELKALRTVGVVNQLNYFKFDIAEQVRQKNEV